MNKNNYIETEYNKPFIDSVQIHMCIGIRMEAIILQLPCRSMTE